MLHLSISKYNGWSQPPKLKCVSNKEIFKKSYEFWSTFMTLWWRYGTSQFEMSVTSEVGNDFESEVKNVQKITDYNGQTFIASSE